MMMMMMMSYKWVTILIITITAIGVHAQTPHEFVICSDTETPTTRDIRCYEDKVINIWTATNDRVAKSHECKRYFSGACGYSLSTAKLRCTGHQSCTVSTEIPGLSFDAGCGDKRILHIRYACETFTNAVSEYNNETRIARGVDLISPGFPCDISERIKSLHCTMKPFNTTGYIYLGITTTLLTIPPGVGDCQEQLFFLTIGETRYTYNKCNQDDDVYEMRNPSVEFRAKTDLEFWYKKHEPRGHGGKFWMTLSSSSEFIMNCNKEYHDQGLYSPEEGNSESCVPFFQSTVTASVPSMRTTTPSDAKEDVNDDQGNDNSNDSMIIGLVSVSVILAVIVAGLTAYIVFGKCRKKQGEARNDQEGEPADDQDRTKEEPYYVEIIGDGVTGNEEYENIPETGRVPGGNEYLQPTAGFNDPIKDNGYLNMEIDTYEVGAKMYTLTDDDDKLKRTSII